MNTTMLDQGNDRPTVAIVDTVDELTPAWLTSALRQRATITPGTSVESAHSTVIGTGQLGHVVRTALTYSGDGQGPPTLVVKLPSEDAGSRGMGSAMGVYEAEVRFYQHIAPLIKARVPHMYSGAVDPGTGRFTLVIEDLGPTAVPGDMIKGSTPEQTALAIDELVPLQAPIWDSPAVTGHPWLDVSRTEMLFAQVPHCVDPFRERFAGRLAPEHMALVEELAPQAPSVTRTIWKPPFVVGHGDYRLDNMMFGSTAADPPIVVLDWQAARLAPPLLDAAIFLSACLTPQERRDHERDLLNRYHSRLTEAGVGGFSREHCWQSYRACSLYPFLLTVAVSVTIAQTERGDAMWARMLGGAADLVLSTGAAEMVG
jgi:hypothetical protein